MEKTHALYKNKIKYTATAELSNFITVQKACDKLYRPNWTASLFFPFFLPFSGEYVAACDSKSSRKTEEDGSKSFVKGKKLKLKGKENRVEI